MTYRTQGTGEQHMKLGKHFSAALNASKRALIIGAFLASPQTCAYVIEAGNAR